MSGAAASNLWEMIAVSFLVLLLLPFVLLGLLGLFIRWCFRKNKVRLARKHGEPIPTWTTYKERQAARKDEARIAQLMQEQQQREHDQRLRAEAQQRLRG